MIMNAQKRQGRRARPEALPYSPQDLRELSAALVAAGGDVAEVADRLEQAGKGASVKINYTQAVHTGLTSVKLLIGDVEKKVTQAKYIYPDERVALPPAATRLPPKTTDKQQKRTRKP